MSWKACCKDRSTCKILFDARFLIIRSFPTGLSVPYILASDGVFLFSFGNTKLVVGKRILQEGIMTLAFLCWRFGFFPPPMREQKLYFLPNEYTRRL